jgi:glycosyltransferase involved in cell wall biosynthesis
VIPVRRGQLTAPQVAADIIVSNLSINWANMPLFASLRATHPNTPLVHIEHSYSEKFVAMHVENRDRFDTLMRAAYSFFDRVVAVSEPQRRWIARREFCPARRLITIVPASDLAPFLALQNRPLPGKQIVGVIGRLDLQKGVDILIDAFKRPALAEHQLHIYGQGPDLEALTAQAADMTNVVFKGFAPNPAEAVAACDIIAMPSRWEPYGLVAVEAMAAGRPLVCSRVDGLAMAIAGGGIDVGENTPDGWATKLSMLSQSDVTEAASKGPAHALAMHKAFVAGWTRLIDELSAQPTPQASAT